MQSFGYARIFVSSIQRFILFQTMGTKFTEITNLLKTACEAAWRIVHLNALKTALQQRQ